VITIECDNCERTFEVEPAEAGAKTACPHCGDVNRVPEPPQPAAAREPEGRNLPPDEGPEMAICDIHPSMFRAHPFRYIGLVAIFAGGVALVFSALRTEQVKWMSWFGVVLCLAAVVGWLIWYIAACLWVKLSISNKRTVRQRGIIRRYTSEVLHDHVRNIEIRQTFLQRITNVGYLGISSSGQDDIEIEIKDVPRPYKLKALIDEYRNL
jgi:uncharacterized membrane protein YdbT with pleckstrin-like domain